MNTISNQHKPEEHSSPIDAVLLRIEKEGITPHSRLYFILRNEFFWCIGIITVIVGALSVSAALFNISHAEFGLYRITHDSWFEFVYDAMPFVWILGLGVFVAIGYIQIKHTKKGYKYPLHTIVGGMLIVSIALGIVLHLFNLGRSTERMVGPFIPFHQPIDIIKQRQWVNTQKGIVAGEIIDFNVSDDIVTSFTVKGFNDQLWYIDSVQLDEDDIAVIATGTKVRVVTLPTKISTTTLMGCIVMPWDEETVVPMIHKINNFERNNIERRNNKCKDMLPYQLLKQMRAVTPNI